MYSRKPPKLDFTPDNHYIIQNRRDFLDYSFKMSITDESLTLFQLGAPGQGYIGLVDLVTGDIHLIPSFNKNDGLLPLDKNGNRLPKFVKSVGLLGQMTGDLHEKACEHVNLWVSEDKPGKGPRRVLGFGVWKGGTGIKFLDKLPDRSGLIPDEFIFILNEDRFQLFYINEFREKSEVEIFNHPILFEYLNTNVSKSLSILRMPSEQRNFIESYIRNHCQPNKKGDSLTDVPIKSAKNRSTSQNAKAVQYSKEYTLWFTGRNRGHTAHADDLIRELPLNIFKKILYTIHVSLNAVMPKDLADPFFPQGVDGIADHLRLELDWMKPSERSLRILEYALFTQNRALVEEAMKLGGKIVNLPITVFIDDAIENHNKERIIHLMVEYAIKNREDTTRLIWEFHNKIKNSEENGQPLLPFFKKLLSEQILQLEKYHKPYIEWMDAAKYGRLEVIKELLETKAIDINYQLIDGATALYIAAEYDRYDIIKELLAHGADSSLGLNNGWNPLLVAADYSYVRALALLMQNIHDLSNFISSPKISDVKKSELFDTSIMRNRLPELIITIDDYFKMGNYPNFSQLREVYGHETVQEKLPRLISDGFDFRKVLGTLPPLQISILLDNKGILMKLPELLNKPGDFILIFRLEPGQIEAIFEKESIKILLLQIFESEEKFYNLAKKFFVTEDKKAAIIIGLNAFAGVSDNVKIHTVSSDGLFKTLDKKSEKKVPEVTANGFVAENLRLC